MDDERRARRERFQISQSRRSEQTRRAGLLRECARVGAAAFVFFIAFFIFWRCRRGVARVGPVWLQRRAGRSREGAKNRGPGSRRGRTKPAPLAIILELPGRIAPTRIAEVRARVSGIIDRRNFEQGSDVNKGDVLYEIDDKPFAIELRGRGSRLEQGDRRARSGNCKRKAQTGACSLWRRIASAAGCGDRGLSPGRGRRRGTQGRRRAGQAQSRLHAIRAPIDGVVGGALVSEGALVVQNETASLRPSSSSIRSMRISPSRSPNSIGCGANSKPAISSIAPDG